MKEFWKSVVGYEKFYQVSNLGRVRSHDRVVPTRGGFVRTHKGQILTTDVHPKTGYHRVTFALHGVNKKITLHRVVLTAFKGAKPDGMVGCHNDGDPSNNKLDNLRWDTLANNQRDKREHGTCGGRAVVRCDGTEYSSLQQAAEHVNGDRSAIAKVCRGKLNTHRGYGYRYA